MATIERHPFADLSDEALTDTVKRLACDERRATAKLVASLAEFDARRLYLGAGCASLFAYCTHVLHLAEHAAYNRIEAARVVRRFPIVLERLADGCVTLTAVRLLAPHLTIDNAGSLLDSARHLSKRDLELLVAGLRPQPPVAASVRKLPASPSPPAPAGTRTAMAAGAGTTRLDAALFPIHDVPPAAPPPPSTRPPVVRPLAPERYRVQFTASPAMVEKLRRAQDLLRHAIPSGDPALVFDRALTALLAQLEIATFAASDRPRAPRRPAFRSRHIPAAVRRAVWKRDQGQCTFVGTEGRCRERGFLQFHHVVPYAAGGEATVHGIALRCAAHNRYEAELEFGQRRLPAAGRDSVATTNRDRPARHATSAS